MTKKQRVIVLKVGTATSGFYQHQGRRGQVGGSIGADGGDPNAPIDEATRIKRERYALAERARYRAHRDSILMGHSEADAKAAGLAAWRAALADYDANMANRAQHPSLHPPTQAAPTPPKFKDGLFYGGDLSQVTGSKEIYDNSHPDVQALARRTGLIATDLESYEYIQKLEQSGALADAASGYTVTPAQMVEHIRNVASSDFYLGLGSPYHPDPTGREFVNAERWNPERHAKNFVDIDFDQYPGVDKQGTTDAQHKAYTQVNMIEDMADTSRRAYDDDSLNGKDGDTFVKWKTGTEAVANSLNVLANAKLPDTRINDPTYRPFAAEARIDALINSWDYAVANGKLPVYNAEGSVIRTQPLSATDKKRIQAMLDKPGKTLEEMHALYKEINDKRSILRKAEFASPNGAYVNRSTTSRRTGGWTPSGPQYSYHTTADMVDPVDDAFKEVRTRQGDSYEVDSFRSDMAQVASIMGPKYYNGAVTGKAAASLWIMSYEKMNRAERIEQVYAADHAWRLRRLNSTIDNYQIYTNDNHIKSTDMNWERANNLSVWADDAEAAYRKANPQQFSAHLSDKFTKYAALSTASPEERRKIVKDIYDGWDNDVHGSFGAKVNNAFRLIQDAELVQQHAAVGRQIGGDELTGYHGTSFEYAKYIASTGFKIPPTANAGRMLGDGIYLATKGSKSAQYLTKGSVTRQPGSHGVMFITHSYLGKVYQVKDSDARWSTDFNAKYRAGYDTVWAQKGKIGLLNEEACSKHEKGTMPTYWLDTTLVDAYAFRTLRTTL